MSTEQGISPNYHHEAALKTLARSNGLLETAKNLNIHEIQGLAAALISLVVKNGGEYFRSVTTTSVDTLQPYARPEIINALTAVNHGSTTLEDIRNAEMYKIWQAFDQHETETTERLPVIEAQLYQNRQEQLDEDDALVPLTDEDIASAEVSTTFDWVSNPTLNLHDDGHRTLSLEVASPFNHEGKNTVQFQAYIQYQDSRANTIQGGSTQALSNFDADVTHLEMTVYQMAHQPFELVVTATNQQTGEKQREVINGEDIPAFTNEE